VANFCPKCGTRKRSETSKFCPKCGYDFRQSNLPALREQTQLTSFDPVRTLSGLINDQQEWLRRNTLLEPLQQIIDNISLRTEMEQATDIQKEQILAGYQDYTKEQVEYVIDQVRHARLRGDAEIALEIKQRNLDIEDAIAEREHQRRLERLREEHRHEKEMMELRAQLELVNAIIQSFNQLKMIQLTAQAEGLADVQQMEMLTQIIKKSFIALAEIDAGQLAYARRIHELEIEDVTEARSFELMDELIQNVTDTISKRVTQFADQSRTVQGTRRGP
jgi:hypothetical protein